MKKKYLHSLNWFRGLAIAFVVLGHTDKGFTAESTLGTFIYAFILNGSAFFVFISGYLFWHLSPAFAYPKYLKTKANNVLFPYLLILTITLISIIGLSSAGIHSSDFSNFEYVVELSRPLQENGIIWHYLIGGAINYPLWFIPMIIIFFIVSPAIKHAANQPYFLAIILISLLYTLFSKRGDIAPLQFLHYLSIYLLGIFCKQHENTLYQHAGTLLAITLPLSLIATYLKMHSVGGSFSIVIYGEAFFFNPISPPQIITTLSALALLMFIEKQSIKPRILDILAKYAFGIFFIHFYFLVVTAAVFNHLGYDNTAIKFIADYFFAITGSVIVCHYTKKFFPKTSRQLLGI